MSVVANKPAELQGYPDALKMHYSFGPYRAAVTRVVDGDTLYCLIDLGFNTYTYHSIRVAGINAPEIRGAERDKGLAAKTYVEDLFNRYGSHVVLNSMKWPQSFGRYVADITYTDGRQVLDLAGVLVEAGHAVWSPS